MGRITSLIWPWPNDYIDDYRLTMIDKLQEVFPPRLQSKLNDGKQVEPALVKPVNGQVLTARQSNRELARE